jgi:hypothetical protein
VSPFISQLIDELGYERVNSVASGNRAMMLLEGKGGAYIRDTVNALLLFRKCWQYIEGVHWSIGSICLNNT